MIPCFGTIFKACAKKLASIHLPVSSFSIDNLLAYVLFYYHTLLIYLFVYPCAFIYLSLIYICAANKGFWADLLGVGDFYYELAVRIIERCIAEKRTTGSGIIAMPELLKKLNAAQSNNTKAKDPVTEQDVEQAVKAIHIFGGFQVISLQEQQQEEDATLLDKPGAAMKPKKFILSIPRELNQDVMIVMNSTLVLTQLRGISTVSYFVGKR
jgi:EAP30/Vps36 family